MCKIVGKLHRILALLIAGVLVGSGGWTVCPQSVPDAGEPGPCADGVLSQTVTATGEIEMDVYYPSGDTCGGVAAPFAGIVLAHGFSMFGLSNGADENAGHGQHLASWGYVVAIPLLPDDAEERIADIREALTYLESEAGSSSSFLYQKVDAGRLAVAGHSLGGATALAVGARDARTRAVVALDPVYHEGGFGQEEYPEVWDHDAEAPDITAPTLILGAPSSNCNSEADYAEIYPYVGATHKAEVFIVGGSHCEFAVPGGTLCDAFCDGEVDPTGARADLIQKYMTAWFNYYLELNPDYYDTLYGAAADVDVAAGLIERDADTAPDGLTATGGVGGVVLEWELYEYPAVAGYAIYRRLPGESYPGAPQAQVGRASAYVDMQVGAGQVYSYTICSSDSAGNLHEPADEVSVVGQGPEPGKSFYLPLAVKSWP